MPPVVQIAGSRTAFGEAAVYSGTGQHELVTLRDAIDQYARARPRQDGASDLYRNYVADLFSRRLTLFSVSEDWETARAVTAAELRSARFIEGGEALVFRDRREPIRRLAVKQGALAAALDALLER